MKTCHVYQHNTSKGTAVRMTRYPMVREDCQKFVNKMPYYAWAWYELEESEVVYPRPKEIVTSNRKKA